MKDDGIAHRIAKLIEDEHGLLQKTELHDTDRGKVKQIEVELDQCWDLLRQRRAKREFGMNPDEAKVRSPDVVERYEQ